MKSSVLNGFLYFFLRGIIPTDYLGFLSVRLVNNALSNRCYLICEKRPLLTQMVEFGLALNSHRCTCVSRIQWAFNEPRSKLETQNEENHSENFLWAAAFISLPRSLRLANTSNKHHSYHLLLTIRSMLEFFHITIHMRYFLLYYYYCYYYLSFFNAATFFRPFSHNRVFLLFFKFEENNKKDRCWCAWIVLSVSITKRFYLFEQE